MSKPAASIWTAAPELGIPEPPALVVESDRLWLAYFRAADDAVAVVRFSGVIDHRLSPINDEGLGRHPYQAILRDPGTGVYYGASESRKDGQAAGY